MGNILLLTTPDLANSAILIARIFIGICFIVHAMGKLGLVGPGNMAGFTGWLKSLGVPFPAFQARMAMATELVGGTLLVIGLFTRPALLALALTMIVAAVIGHKGGGYLITNNPQGNEYAINLAVVCLLLMALGPGAYSLDAFLFS